MYRFHVITHTFETLSTNKVCYIGLNFRWKREEILRVVWIIQENILIFKAIEKIVDTLM